MSGRDEVRAAIQAVLDGTEWDGWGGRGPLSNRLLSEVPRALAAQEGERGGLPSLVADAKRAMEQVEDGTCQCPDEPHQNLLHDIAQDLAHEGERGGAEVAAAVETWAETWLADWRGPLNTAPRRVIELRAALADSAGALAKHDAEVLRAAADRLPAFHDRDVPEWAITSACKWLRERADRIAGDQP